MALELHTARLGYRGPVPWLDVSLQGNLQRVERGAAGGQDGIGIFFAPPPDLLYPFLSKRKWGRLRPEDWPRYADEYTAIMRARYRDPVTRRAFDRVLERDALVLLCFCKDAERCEGARCTVDGCAHCHRRVLADILVKVGAHVGREVVYRGELDVAAGAKPVAAPGELVLGETSGRCTPFAITDESGQRVGGGIICGGRGRQKRCAVCKDRRSTKLCDFPLEGAKRGKTCDMALCSRCAVSVDENVDYCPPHARRARGDA